MLTSPHEVLAVPALTKPYEDEARQQAIRRRSSSSRPTTDQALVCTRIPGGEYFAHLQQLHYLKKHGLAATLLENPEQELAKLHRPCDERMQGLTAPQCQTRLVDSTPEMRRPAFPFSTCMGAVSAGWANQHGPGPPCAHLTRTPPHGTRSRSRPAEPKAEGPSLRVCLWKEKSCCGCFHVSTTKAGVLSRPSQTTMWRLLNFCDDRDWPLRLNGIATARHALKPSDLATLGLARSRLCRGEGQPLQGPFSAVPP
jgi:hypothetical protein